MDRRIDFVTNEADERPIYAVFGDILWCRDTGNEYIYDGSTWQEYKMRYKDLGLVIDAVNVAAGATVYGVAFNTRGFYGGNVELIVQNNDGNKKASIGYASALKVDEIDSLYTFFVSDITISSNKTAIHFKNTNSPNAGISENTKFAIKNSDTVTQTSIKLWARVYNTAY